MAVSKAQQRATNKYKKNNYDRMELVVPKGQKDTIKAHAADLGESVNGFIGRAISETMERDGGGMPSETAGKPAGAAQGAGVVSPVRTAQEKAETEKQPDSVDKAKAWEKILEIFHDVGTVDLERARDERLGIMFLPPDTLEAAQRAAEAAGESVPDFMARAVTMLAQTDQGQRERVAATKTARAEPQQKASVAPLPTVGVPVPMDKIRQTVKANMPGICSLINAGERRASSKGRSKPSQVAEYTLRDLFEAGYTVEEVRAAAETAAREGYTDSWYSFPKYCAKLYGRKWVDPR